MCSIEFGCGHGKKPKEKTRARIERTGYRILIFISWAIRTDGFVLKKKLLCGFVGRVVICGVIREWTTGDPDKDDTLRLL